MAFTLRSTLTGLFALALVAASTTALHAQEAVTDDDFYGTYELILPGFEAGAPGSEMIATWNEAGMIVKQRDNVIIETGISLGSTPGTMVIWDENGQDPTCAAEGLYLYEDDGTTITLEVLSDECQGRVQSANGAKMVRLD